LKILILKPSSLGDVIHALPVLRLLKRHWPASEIHWWVDRNLAPLLEGDPDLAGLYLFERRGWTTAAYWLQTVESIRAMRQTNFDLALDLQGLGRSGLFAWLANAQLTVGLDNPKEGRREGARAFYDVRPAPALPQTHAVDRYLSVLSVLGVPAHQDFDWLPERPAIAAEVRRKWRTEGSAWTVLLPGARWGNKRWPASHFRRLRELLSAEPGGRFVILGAPNEQAIGEAIAENDPERCLNLIGKTSLWEMIEWIRLSRLVVTNDTGPMHVAAALRKPVVATFGPTDPRLTGPYGQLEHVAQRRDLPCVPCMKDTCRYRDPLACLTGISAEDVARRVETSFYKIKNF
jgi:lipopolysaccharide heptosyltransferase I